MREFDVIIMSIDPNDHYGREQGDDHQKYGLEVKAKDKASAEKKGMAKFKRENPNLPIHWVKVY